MRLYSDQLQTGMLVRYGKGETALAVLTQPHAGGWHGKQCMGGVTFMTEFYTPSLTDRQTWVRCEKWRRDERQKDMSYGLTFNTLREANAKRAETAEKFAACKNWTLDQWFKALVGEIGEFANISKKVDRGDLTIDEAKEDLAKEIADVQIYLDLMANNLGIDLGQATREKFNEVSRRIGSFVVIGHDGDMHFLPENFKHG